MTNRPTSKLYSKEITGIQETTLRITGEKCFGSLAMVLLIQNLERKHHLYLSSRVRDALYVQMKKGLFPAYPRIYANFKRSRTLSS